MFSMFSMFLDVLDVLDVFDVFDVFDVSEEKCEVVATMPAPPSLSADSYNCLIPSPCVNNFYYVPFVKTFFLYFQFLKSLGFQSSKGQTENTTSVCNKCLGSLTSFMKKQLLFRLNFFQNMFRFSYFFYNPTFEERFVTATVWNIWLPQTRFSDKFTMTASKKNFCDWDFKYL